MSMLKDFKAFAMRGNVVDMAVGIIIGAAFGKIVSSLVTDVIMPPIGFMMGGVDFSNLSIKIKDATLTAPAVGINYGVFINTVINFIIVAAAIFMLVSLMNRMIKKEEAAPTLPPAPSKEQLLLTEIRDILKTR
jgi:large conductance mechanosensitive channel